ncbi:amidohydrolase family protein [Herbiconiux moechotypicola]|uniref:Amidohydrolase n=1 Tax=Herbiconiux moechotypicola TaxID=637393 RepID=A0ABN3DS34_9MICO|nr:amidohydrolase family protein [Herbiconiux moechotypicola]MCS5730666.1 amidohydrolase family protein [Herbiconiux moechotypicola]
MTATLFVADAVHGHVGARGVVVRENRITAVVGDRELRRVGTTVGEVIELGGHVYPGFTDAHSHPSLGAGLQRGVDLSDVDDLAALRSVLSDAVREIPPGEWLLGWGLSYGLWDDDQPTSAVLRGLGRPVALQLFDCHALLLDEEAVRVAGVERMPAFGSGAHAVRDERGAFTGLVVEEEAMDHVRLAIPPEHPASRTDRLGRVLAAMAASGLTGLHVMDALGDSAEQYDELERTGRLPLRLKLHRWYTPALAAAGVDPVDPPPGRGRLWHHHGVKLFLDGTVDNGTAWLSSPDLRGESTGSTWGDPVEYARVVQRLAAAGVPTATHAIGDAAILWAADTIARAHAAHPAVRHRIEHLEVTSPAAVAAVGRSGAVASVQPTHCTRFVAADGSDNWSRRLGDRRSHGWRLRSLAASGTVLALGSDFPIAPFEPLGILADAVSRRCTARGGEAVSPLEALGADEAVLAYTVGAALAAGVEHDEGTIAPGRLADLSVFDGDLSAATPEQLLTRRAVATVVDGEFRRS